MLGRTLLLTVCLLTTWGYLGFAARAEPTPIRAPLSALPLSVGEFRGRVEPPLTDEVLEILKVDDYTIRSYSKNADQTLGFYVGYHATQRQGASIHSPQNCLPGAGWTPAEQRRLTVDVLDAAGGQSRRIEVNRVVIERGLDRQLVVYWYQSHGRVVASEYWGKIYSVVDAIRYNRSDAALVRIIVPMATPGSEGIARAEELALEFVQAVFPRLSDHLPS
jgi:EpsI family protein